jgi:hypothetical protein
LENIYKQKKKLEWESEARSEEQKEKGSGRGHKSAPSSLKFNLFFWRGNHIYSRNH